MLEWPPLNESATRPIWNGRGFQVGSQTVPVLCYADRDSGWSEGLAQIHEESAGRDHYIDRASRAHALEALRPILGRGRPVVMEIGCNKGYFLADLIAHAPHAVVIGADYLSPASAGSTTRCPACL